MIDKRMLFYDAIHQFQTLYFKDLLTINHLQGGEVRIDKLSFPDSGTDESANFWGYILEKGGIKYLLPSKTTMSKNLDISSMFPIMAKDLEKVAYRGNVYWLINKPVQARFKAEKKMEFRQFVDLLTSFKHTNTSHYKLMTLIGLTSMLDRANFRISSPPGFGKDSIVDTMGGLFGSATTIENPTIAKLEYLSIYKWMAVNEVVDIKNADWKVIEQFLLSAGAYKSTIAKHSRAIGSVGEILNISNLSLSLLYNDIDCYSKSEEYIDFVAKKAVLDRFPCFRFYGKFEEDFGTAKNEEIEDIVFKNFDTYKDIIYTFTYYKDNLLKELHNYSTAKIIKLPQRWNLSVGKLLRVVDIYSQSQEEFDEWIDIINKSILDYETMLSYPSLVNNVITRIPNPTKLNDFNKEVKKFNTFHEKIDFVRGFLSKKNEIVKGEAFW